VLDPLLTSYAMTLARLAPSLLVIAQAWMKVRGLVLPDLFVPLLLQGFAPLLPGRPALAAAAAHLSGRRRPARAARRPPHSLRRMPARCCAAAAG